MSYRQNSRVTVVNCHPKFRGLGPKPTTQTGNYSRGACNGGPPKEGTFWLARALELAKFATERLGPAMGTEFGFPKGRFTLKQVAGDQLHR